MNSFRFFGQRFSRQSCRTFMSQLESSHGIFLKRNKCTSSKIGSLLLEQSAVFSSKSLFPFPEKPALPSMPPRAHYVTVAPAIDVANTEEAADSIAKESETLSSESTDEEVVDRRKLATWLLLSAGLVFSMVALGGITRLTESGLSMVDWSLLHFQPPRTQEEWLAYFERYQASPEYILLNNGMSLEEFKKIYYMEYSHRMLGRFLGAFYFFPMLYFMITRRKTMPRKQFISLAAIAGLIMCQGLMGWYMVKSGLDPKIIEDQQVPRVSQYRLAAHLSLAFLIYVMMLKQGLSILRPPSLFPLAFKGTKESLKKLRIGTLITSKLIFVTAFSGAFVAGLDADGLSMLPFWINIFENPSLVQFNHRVLAMTTFTTITGLWIFSRTLKLPLALRRAANLLMMTASAQVLLGISTLIYLVPVPLAAAHQAGSLTLLTVAMYMMSLLRRVRL